jgi:hypothetical protein
MLDNPDGDGDDVVFLEVIEYQWIDDDWWRLMMIDDDDDDCYCYYYIITIMMTGMIFLVAWF